MTEVFATPQVPVTRPGPALPERRATTRHYLMCPPLYFDVEYAINPWMDPSAPLDRELALAQWEDLRRAYESLGHRVDLLDPVEGLPDMVFSANGAAVFEGRVYGARFANPERAAEAPAHRAWFTAAGFRVHEPAHVNEGEGDLVVMADRILAGTGFRTTPEAHREAQELFGVPVISLQLVDPRYYHLDVALFDLGDGNIAYYPGAFSDGSRRLLERLYPDAVLASERDASVLGLNAVSDGLNVVLPAGADDLASALRLRGFQVVEVDMSELRKSGGGPKCCTQEIRR